MRDVLRAHSHTCIIHANDHLGLLHRRFAQHDSRHRLTALFQVFYKLLIEPRAVEYFSGPKVLIFARAARALNRLVRTHECACCLRALKSIPTPPMLHSLMDACVHDVFMHLLRLPRAGLATRLRRTHAPSSPLAEWHHRLGLDALATVYESYFPILLFLDSSVCVILFCS